MITKSNYKNTFFSILAIFAFGTPCLAVERESPAHETAKLIDAGRYREALSLLEKGDSQAEKDLEARTLLARAYLGTGRYREAETTLAKPGAGVADPAALEILARAAEAQGNLDRAIGLMTEAVEAKRKSLASTETVEGASALAEYRTRLGELAFRAGRLDPAKEQFQKAVSLVNQAHAKLHEQGIPHDESDPRMFAAGATAGLAQVYAAKGDNARAERTWRGVAARASDPTSLANLAAFSLAKNDPKTARRHFDRALRLSENKPAYRRARALILIDRGETSDEALTLAEAAYKDGPDIYARDTLAWVLHRRGDTGRAWEILGPALTVGTRDPLVLYHAGAIAQALGKREDAKRLLAQALATNPAFDPVAARDAQQALERLR
ncbi:tetratricopeptide repeat protein [Singulisphaera acidiphila]|uniref:Thioredoxin domain-containing protein n=1 Tax=Singulisphaera acidiphila (strain ATCC BAA-1392 / DSM 18658 / VKM B-2454 / MOB10) TaxID=886293 RepID=L0DQA6_SINAD|nr:tetratricopeptide repeat protein [Singulisphaera acidiphila]AGA31040.1 thioredoxin domain-containing protein [Singulisphaera acidiphila DSM 18658]